MLCISEEIIQHGIHVYTNISVLATSQNLTCSHSHFAISLVSWTEQVVASHVENCEGGYTCARAPEFILLSAHFPLQTQ